MATKERSERIGAVAKLEVKALGENTPEGTFAGHGAIFDVLHETSAWMLSSDWQDVIRPGAFKRTLAEHKARGSRPAMLRQHDMECPVGAWRVVEEDKAGLYCEGICALKTEDGLETYELIKLGAIPALSIGFSVVKATLNEDKKVREILDVDLYEVSPVVIPGNPSALITDVKSLTRGSMDPRNIRDLEQILRDAGLSARESKALLASGFRAMAGERDADLTSALQSALESLKKLGK